MSAITVDDRRVRSSLITAANPDNESRVYLLPVDVMHVELGWTDHMAVIEDESLIAARVRVAHK